MSKNPQHEIVGLGPDEKIDHLIIFRDNALHGNIPEIQLKESGINPDDPRLKKDSEYYRELDARIESSIRSFLSKILGRIDFEIQNSRLDSYTRLCFQAKISYDEKCYLKEIGCLINGSVDNGFHDPNMFSDICVPRPLFYAYYRGHLKSDYQERQIDEIQKVREEIKNVSDNEFLNEPLENLIVLRDYACNGGLPVYKLKNMSLYNDPRLKVGKEHYKRRHNQLKVCVQRFFRNATGVNRLFALGQISLDMQERFLFEAVLSFEEREILRKLGCELPDEMRAPLRHMEKVKVHIPRNVYYKFK